MYLSHDLQFERFMFYGTYIFQDEGECATESGMSQYLGPIHIHLSGCCTLEGGHRSYFGNGACPGLQAAIIVRQNWSDEDLAQRLQQRHLEALDPLISRCSRDAGYFSTMVL